MRQVICRSSQKYHGHVFEVRDLDSEGHVVHHHSRKKLFMAESNDEMARWIEAIRTVCVDTGSCGSIYSIFSYFVTVLFFIPVLYISVGNDWLCRRFWCSHGFQKWVRGRGEPHGAQ